MFKHCNTLLPIIFKDYYTAFFEVNPYSLRSSGDYRPRVFTLVPTL